MEVGQYSGDSTGKQVIVGGDYIEITFSSDHIDEGRRFLISFTAVQPSEWNRNAA